MWNNGSVGCSATGRLSWNNSASLGTRLWLAEGDLADPVLLFEVEDKDRYLDGLPVGLKKLEGEGEIYEVGEDAAGAEAAADEWDLAPAESYAVGVATGRLVATASSVDAVKAAVALVEAGALAPGQVAGESDAGVIVRVSGLLDYLDETAQNPFPMAKMAMGQAFMMQPGAGPDQQRMVELLLDGCESVLDQLQAVAIG